jgi:hypothetical protein
VFALAIWNWKRWGVYGEIGIGLVRFVVYLSLADFPSALLNLVGFLVLILLLILEDRTKHPSEGLAYWKV